MVEHKRTEVAVQPRLSAGPTIWMIVKPEEWALFVSDLKHSPIGVFQKPFIGTVKVDVAP